MYLLWNIYDVKIYFFRITILIFFFLHRIFKFLFYVFSFIQTLWINKIICVWDHTNHWTQSPVLVKLRRPKQVLEIELGQTCAKQAPCPLSYRSSSCLSVHIAQFILIVLLITYIIDFTSSYNMVALKILLTGDCTHCILVFQVSSWKQILGSWPFNFMCQQGLGLQSRIR